MVLAVRGDPLVVPRWIVPIQDDEPPMTFGSRIKREREARGWSQEFVAEQIGVRQGKISSYELDRVKDPPFLNVIALEDLFDLPRGELGVLLWGERVRDELRRWMDASRTFAIAKDSPSALHDVIEIIGVLEENDLEEIRDQVRERWQRRRGRGENPPTPLRG